MYEVKASLLKNRLYITIGKVFSKEIKDISKDVEKVAWELRPGFTCITRITDLGDLTEHESGQIKKIQDYLLSIGMAKVVRVGYQPGTQALEKTGKEVGYSAESVSSIKKAERILDDFVSGKS
ncbi:MAG: hypothetical protein KAH06_09370 [Desulfobacterales bacterium]|nr:hypothetical protein [Desulfobacterales bacterium]